MRNRRRVGLVIAVGYTVTALTLTAAPPRAYLPHLQGQVVARVTALRGAHGLAGGTVHAQLAPVGRAGGAWGGGGGGGGGKGGGGRWGGWGPAFRRGWGGGAGRWGASCGPRPIRGASGAPGRPAGAGHASGSGSAPPQWALPERHGQTA